MDVRLPDGTIVRNVPEGTTRAQLMARMGKAQPKIDAAGAGAYGFGDMATFGLLDEAGAVVDSLGLTKGRKNIWNGASFGDAYRANVGQNRQILKRSSTEHPVATTVGQVAGAIATPVPFASAIRLSKAPKLLKAVAEGAIQGGLYGAGSGEGGLANRANNAKRDAIAGGIGGGAGYTAAKAIGGALKGIARTPAAQRLANRKIGTTIGQAVGGRAKNIEDRLAGLPVVGGRIREMRRDQFEQVLRSAADETLEPIGAKAPPAASGRELYAATKDIADDAYGAAVANINAPVDDALVQSIQQVSSRPLTPVQREAFDALMADEIAPRLESGQIAGDDLQAMKEILDGEIRGYRNTPGSRRMVKALGDIRQNLFDFVERNGAGEQYNAARETYKRAKTLQKAVEASTSDGIPTPRQLGIAARQSARKFGSDSYARGTAPLQGLADDATQVLPSAIPDSGTAGQLGFLNILNNPIRNTPKVLSGMALGLPYSKAGNSVLQSLLFDRPDLLRWAGEQLGSRGYVGGVLGAPLAVQAIESGR